MDISYKDYNKNSDIHGSVLYPATMIAPMQKQVISDLCNKSIISNVFDPFHGSGTALYEAFEVKPNMHLYGCDINPLANLITTTKLRGVSNNIKNNINTLTENILNPILDFPIHNFNNINKWFRNDIIFELSKIKYSISKIKSKKDRFYFWCMMINIIRKYSNSRSSTYKLHIKKESSITNMKNNIIKDFIYSIKNNYSFFMKMSKNFNLYKLNILELIPSFDDNFFDLIITSPPYGDNGTTVTYGQYSSLPLFWIDSKDLNLEGWELSNYSIIDTKSLGSKRNEKENFDNFELSIIDPYLKNISSDKQTKVVNFFVDYFCFLKESCRVSNKYIVLTLGNRTVDGVNINLTKISKTFLENKGFKNIGLYEREIVKKRIPNLTSNVKGKPVKSMNNEYLLVHEMEN